MANLDPARVEGAHPAAAAPFLLYSSLHERAVIDAARATIDRLDDLVNGRAMKAVAWLTGIVMSGLGVYRAALTAMGAA